MMLMVSTLLESWVALMVSGITALLWHGTTEPWYQRVKVNHGIGTIAFTVNAAFDDIDIDQAGPDWLMCLFFCS